MGYLGSQAVRAATQFADSRQELFAPAHLLLAVLDQADAEVLERLNSAGIDPARVRAVAAEMLGAPSNLPMVPMPALCLTGTYDRPPRPIDQLDPQAWACCLGARATYPLAVSSARATGKRFRTSSAEPPGKLPTAGASTTTSATRCSPITVTASRPWPMRLAPISSRPASSSSSSPSARCLALGTSSVYGPGGGSPRTSWAAGRRGSPIDAPACGTSTSGWLRARNTGANRPSTHLAEPCHPENRLEPALSSTPGP